MEMDAEYKDISKFLYVQSVRYVRELCELILLKSNNIQENDFVRTGTKSRVTKLFTMIALIPVLTSTVTYCYLLFYLVS